MTSTSSVPAALAKTYLPSLLTRTPNGFPKVGSCLVAVFVSVFPAAAVALQPGDGRNANGGTTFLAEFGQAAYVAPPPIASSATSAPASARGDRHPRRRPLEVPSGQASSLRGESSSVAPDADSTGPCWAIVCCCPTDAASSRGPWPPGAIPGAPSDAGTLAARCHAASRVGGPAALPSRAELLAACCQAASRVGGPAGLLSRPGPLAAWCQAAS